MNLGPQACTLCSKQYNYQSVKPVNLNCCGRQICNNCREIFSNVCPYCKKASTRLSGSVSPIPTPSKTSFRGNCHIHKREYMLICETCMVLICPNCVPEHPNHEIESLDTYLEDTKARQKDSKRYLEQAFVQLSTLDSMIKEGIRQKRKYLDDYYENKILALTIEYDDAKKRLDECFNIPRPR